LVYVDPDQKIQRFVARDLRVVKIKKSKAKNYEINIPKKKKKKKFLVNKKKK